MPLAAKHFDLIVGLDVHIVQPPGPVPPTPIPHPHVGMVFDPFDWIPLIGSTVTVNGLPRAQAGSAGLILPTHIPIGGVFIKPPGNENEVLMGSSTVVVEDEPFSYMALPVLACADIGMPPPLRPPKPDDGADGPGKKPKASKTKGPPIGLMLPAAVVLPIPIGKPVMVGGAPTISMLALGGRMAFAALGAGFKGLRKLQKQSERAKNISAKLHRKASKYMDALGISPSARHKVHNAICTVTGHPVDVATGKVFTDAVDLDIPGPLPLCFERTWYSTSTYSGPLGHGWHHNLDFALIEGADVVALRLADGRFLAAPRLRVGESFFERAEKLTLERDARGYRLRLADGVVFGFSLAAEGVASPLAFVEDPAGNRIQLRYREGVRLSEIVDSGGRRFAVVCDDVGRIVEIRGPHPEQDTIVTYVRYSYDRSGDLVEAHDALGQAARYRYVQHLLVQETDRAGLSFYFEWDNGIGPERAPSEAVASPASGRCIRTWGDGGIHDHRLAWAGDQVTVTNGLGHTVVCRITDDGLVDRTVDPLGNVSTIERNEWREVIATVDPLGRRTRFVRDARGNPVQIVQPDGGTQVFSYDDRDRPIRAVDVLGNWWQWRWDERGLLVELAGPEQRTRWVWQGSRLAARVEANGTLRFEYDESGNPVRLLVGERATLETRHDRLGRIIAERGAGGAQRVVRRDLLGRPIAVQEPDGNLREAEYDPEGRVIRERDRIGESRYRWAGMGRLVERQTADGNVQRFSYDGEERLVELVNELGHRHRFELDARGDVVAEIGFDGGRTIYERDAYGRVTGLTSPSGRKRTHRWNPSGQLAAVETQDGTKIEFAYRADGALISARNPTCTVRIERDQRGRVVREWQNEHWVSSELDRGGRRSRMRSSFGADLQIGRSPSGAWMGMRYRDAHDPESRELWRVDVQRDVVGREVDRMLLGGVRSRWGFDVAGRPFQHQLWDGRAVARDRRYSWEVRSRIRQIAESPDEVIEYGHDPRGILSWARRSNGETQWRVPDPVGNLYRSQDLQDRRYGPMGNLLEARDPRSGERTRYEWDDDGQLVRREDSDGGVWKYRWNDLGQLVAVERPDGDLVEFGYDAFSRRMWKRCEGQITRWVWDGDVILHEWRETDGVPVRGKSPRNTVTDEEEDATGFVLPAFVPDPARAVIGDDEETGYVEPAFVNPRAKGEANIGEFLRPAPRGLVTWLFEPDRFAPIARIVGAVALSVVADHLGTPLAMLDGQGREVWGARYEVDGGVEEERGEEGACPFRFPGQYADAETGLYYNLFRYYDPNAGLYTSIDPLGLAGGSARFSYVGDPLVSLDPFGLVPSGPYTTCAQLFSSRILDVGTFYNVAGVPVRGYSIANRAGGATWVFDDLLWSEQSLQVIGRRHPSQQSLHLGGVHGTVDGRIEVGLDHKAMVGEDVWNLHVFRELSPWSPYAKNVRPVSLSDVVVQQDFAKLDTLINGPGQVVCAWCFSERSIAVQHALAGTLI